MEEVETHAEAVTKTDDTAEMQEKKTYELAYHLVPTLGGDDLAARVDVLRKLIEDRGGVIFNEVYPESFELAYTMTKRIQGKIERFATSNLGWINFEATADGIEEMQQIIQKDESVLRFLLVTTDREAAMQFTTPLAKREDTPTIVTETPEKPVEEVKKEVKEEKEEISEEEVDEAIEKLVV